MDQHTWNALLAAAKSGDPEAANRTAGLLLHWVQRHPPRGAGADRDDICAAFVEYLIRDAFAHLPELRSGGLSAFLRKCRTRFVVSWKARTERYRAWEVPWGERAGREDDLAGHSGVDDLRMNAPGPEEIVLRRQEIAELRAVVRGMSERDQRIFVHFFEEGLSEPEIGRLLGMSTPRVGARVHVIRQHLRQWREAREV